MTGWRFENPYVENARRRRRKGWIASVYDAELRGPRALIRTQFFASREEAQRWAKGFKVGGNRVVIRKS